MLRKELAQVDVALKSAFKHSQLSSEFLSRAMAALPAQAARAETSGARPLVFAAQPESRRRWAAVGMAAAVAVVVLVGLMSANFPGTSAPPAVAQVLSIQKGRLTDTQGNSVRELKTNTVYQVQQDTVLPVDEDSLIRFQPGAAFSMRKVADAGGAELKLQSGDLYAFRKNDRKPLQVSCNTFDTRLKSGHFFIADEGGVAGHGVVIAFSGQAEVIRRNESIALQPGQIFISMVADDHAFAQVVEMVEVEQRLQVQHGSGKRDNADLRREYEQRVNGYRREMDELQQTIQKAGDAQQQAELRERFQRVTEYYEAHQRKLQALKHEFPLEIIRRGLNGDSDPSKWM